MGGIDGPIGLNDRMNVLCHHVRRNSYRLSRLRELSCDTGDHDGTESTKDPSRCSLDHGKPLHQLSEVKPMSNKHIVIGVMASIIAYLCPVLTSSILPIGPFTSQIPVTWMMDSPAR
jgi:hypothetical protein